MDLIFIYPCFYVITLLLFMDDTEEMVSSIQAHQSFFEQFFREISGVQDVKMAFDERKMECFHFRNYRFKY